MKLSEEYYIADKMDLQQNYRKILNYLVRNNRDDLEIMHSNYRLRVVEIELLEFVPDYHKKSIHQLLNNMSTRISFWKYNLRHLSPVTYTLGFVTWIIVMATLLGSFTWSIDWIVVMTHIMLLVQAVGITIILIFTGLNYRLYKKGRGVWQ